MQLSHRVQPYVLAVLASLALVASGIYDLYRERVQEIDTARSQTAALVRLLEEQIHQYLQRADAEMSARMSGGGADLVAGIVSNARALQAPIEGDAAWAARLLQAAPGTLVVGRAHPGAHEDWHVTVGKRARTEGGADGHAWEARVALLPLQRALDTADTRNNGFATLFSTDGWLLATAPRNDALVARHWIDTPLFKEHLPRAPSGTVQQVIVRDGTERLYSYQTVRGYPLVISAGISMTDALAGWRERRLWHALLLSAITLALMAAAFGMSRTARRREQAQQAMLEARNDAQRSEVFLRHLADSLPLQIAYADADLRYRFVNRAKWERFGLTHDEVIGRTRRELTGRPMPPELEQAIQRVLHGEPQSIEFRENDVTGSPQVLATLLEPDRDDSGRVMGFYVASLDVTERFEQRQRLDAALVERETLLREVYHRVKNNLQVVQSLLRLQRRTMVDGAALAALDDSARRVHAMALVHELLYQTGSLEAVSLRAYTVELLSHVAETTGAKVRNIQLHAEVDDANARLDAAIPYGLLVNELVSNSIKHGFAGRLAGSVQLKVEHAAPGMRLTVRDDGVGLPGGFDLERDASMGLQLAASLSSQLGGHLRVCPHEGGAAFTIVMLAFGSAQPQEHNGCLPS